VLYTFNFNNSEEAVIKRETGFTLIELLITMVIFVLVIAAGSQIFTGLLTQFKQQSKIAETNIEGIVGLEILRQDIDHAGYGLPWTGLVTYNESGTNPYNLNDSATTSAPKAIVSANNVELNGSDYLVVKALNVARNNTCRKWTNLKASPFTAPFNPRDWASASENLSPTDNVIVLLTGTTAINERRLVVSGSTFSTIFNNVTSTPWAPTDLTEARLVYGVDPDTALRMPFNRADYYISNTNVPQNCAPNTGVLEKATVNHGGGGFNTMPLLDCVADMQVIYGLDNDNDGDFEPGVAGSTDGYSADITALSAQQIREQVRQVRVYILAHEGRYDRDYTYPNSTIAIPAPPDPGAGLGSTFNLPTRIGTNWQNYRWKVYTMVETPNNLR